MRFDEFKDLNFTIGKVTFFFLAIEIERSQKALVIKEADVDDVTAAKIILHIAAVDIAGAELVGLPQHRRARKLVLRDDHVLLPVLFGVELEHPGGDIDTKGVKKDARFPFLRGGHKIFGEIAQKKCSRLIGDEKTQLFEDGRAKLAVIVDGINRKYKIV